MIICDVEVYVVINQPWKLIITIRPYNLLQQMRMLVTTNRLTDTFLFDTVPYVIDAFDVLSWTQAQWILLFTDVKEAQKLAKRFIIT